MINYSIWCFWSFYHFLRSNVPANMCHKQKGVLFFTLIKLVASGLARAHAIAHIKWRRLLLACSIWIFYFNRKWKFVLLNNLYCFPQNVLFIFRYVLKYHYVWMITSWAWWTIVVVIKAVILFLRAPFNWNNFET